MYFYRNISENKYGSEGSYLSCVTKGEFYFSRSIFFHMFVFPIILKIFPRKQFFRDGDKLQLDLVQRIEMAKFKVFFFNFTEFI